MQSLCQIEQTTTCKGKKKLLFHEFFLSALTKRIVNITLEALQPPDVHHIVGLVGHHGHDVEGLAKGLGFLGAAGPLRILDDGL